jgi:dihydrodipicolinate synthase/N-acetylneuraminate lyase
VRFRSDPASIRGSIAPVVSPFTADGAPDPAALRSLIRWQLESGSHGISLGGSTGEPSAQTTRERADAIKLAAEEIADRVPFVPGTGSAKLGLHPVTDVIFTETNPAAAKWVLARAGLIGSGYVRPPLVPLTEPGQAKALALLKQGAPMLEGPIAKVVE